MEKQMRRNYGILIVCLIILVILGACTPKTTSTQDADEQENEIVPTATMSVEESLVDYLVNLPMSTADYSPDQISNPTAKMNSPESLTGSGAFPDNYFTSDILHTGARGCMSCHADLYGLIKNLGPTLHVLSSPPTFGKLDDIKYCQVCHNISANLTGPQLQDIIHASHWNNELFEDTYNGSCWSCHAIDVNGEMVIWDNYKYEANLAGFFDGTADDVINWQTLRGFENGNMIGFEMVEDLSLDIIQE